jgi:hypothetical protein
MEKKKKSDEEAKKRTKKGLTEKSKSLYPECLAADFGFVKMSHSASLFKPSLHE